MYSFDTYVHFTTLSKKNETQNVQRNAGTLYMQLCGVQT